LSAVEAGVGVAAIPEKWIPPSLIRAREYYLPPIPPIKVLLCARTGLESPVAAQLLKRLAMLFCKDPLQSTG
jgi:hypothetical protein